MPFGIRMRWKIKSTKSGCLCNRDTNWIIQGPIRCIFCSSSYQGMCGINTKDYACSMPPVWWDWLKFGITNIVTEVWTSKPGWHSLQNKIWNLADWSTILRKFIYDFKRRKASQILPDRVHGPELILKTGDGQVDLHNHLSSRTSFPEKLVKSPEIICYVI